jgi:hypothetical protein
MRYCGLEIDRVIPVCKIVTPEPTHGSIHRTIQP